jgi:hypothetical protein
VPEIKRVEDLGFRVWLSTMTVDVSMLPLLATYV